MTLRRARSASSLLAIVSALAATGPSPPDAWAVGVSTVRITVVDHDVRTLAPNGRSFSQSALLSHGGFQYATYWDSANRLCVARREIPHATWEVIRFEDYLIEGGDAHETTVLGISAADGRIHLAFDHHTDPLHYRVSDPWVAASPQVFDWSADLFGPVTSSLGASGPIDGVTYPRFLAAPEGDLHFLFRVGVAGDGDSVRYDYDAITGTWEPRGVFLSRQGWYEGSGSRNGYFNGFQYAAAERLHATWIWREGAPETNHDLLYVYSDDRGASWRTSEGTLVTLPVTIDSPDVEVWVIPMGSGLLNQSAQAVDGEGRIHVVMATLEKDRYTHYWRDHDGLWHQTPIAIPGGRPKLVFDEVNNAYLVAPGLQFLAATPSTGWTDWRVVHEESGYCQDPGGEPVVDILSPNELSVYHQKGAALHVVDCRLHPFADLIWSDGFETGDVGRWSAAASEGALLTPRSDCP